MPSIVLDVVTETVFSEKETEERIINGYIKLPKENEVTIKEFNDQSVKIGSSSLYITMPYTLTNSIVDLPLEMKIKLSKSEIYSFSKDKTFQGKVSYMVWKPEIDYNLEYGANGSLDNIKNLPGVEKILEKKEYFNKDNLEGYFINAEIYRYGKSFRVKSVIIKRGQETWVIIISILNRDDEQLAEQIIKSIKYLK